ncbi:MAG: rhomboid family intramembrane serine protease, partial [Pseudomonadales bacterium]|nr:rhomboid family intramembrane serine protease [Pseudomonadales bacterium]
YMVHLVDAGKRIAILELGALTETAWSQGEFYRFSSWFFLHSGIFHLLINTLTFASLSTLLLRVIDFSRYLCLLLLSTLFAAFYVLSVTPEHYVIGASAGIFGLFGAHCALTFNRYLPVSISPFSNKFIVLLIVLEFIMEAFTAGVSLAAHLGGGVTGYALMRTVLYFNPSNRIYESTRLEKGLALVLVLATLAGLLRFLALAAQV